MPDLTTAGLIALEHENWISYLIGVTSCTKEARVTRASGVMTLLTGLPMDWFNQMLVEREDATRADVLAAVIGARESGEPFAVRLREEIDDRFIPILIRAGLAATEPGHGTPGMVAFPIDRDAAGQQPPPELEIHRVTDAAGIDAHRAAVTAGFGADPVVAQGTVCPDLLNRPECAIYVGYADGDAVVSGLGWRTGRTIGVYSIATVEPARRRGYGAAMTARVMADGVAAGCDVATLQTSDLGRPIYERLGFRTVVRYASYTAAADVGIPRDLPETRLDHEPMDTQFSGELYYWRGPAPYHFIKVPEAVCVELRALSPVVSYGWGMIPVSVRIGASPFETSLFPKDGGYVLPVKDAVRDAEGLAAGDNTTVELAVRSR